MALAKAAQAVATPAMDAAFVTAAKAATHWADLEKVLGDCATRADLEQVCALMCPAKAFHANRTAAQLVEDAYQCLGAVDGQQTSRMECASGSVQARVAAAGPARSTHEFCAAGTNARKAFGDSLLRGSGSASLAAVGTQRSE